MEMENLNDMEFIWKILGDNFIGIVYRLLFSSADGKQSSSLFLKVAPTDEEKRQMFRVHPCFMRETYAYEVVRIQLKMSYLIFPL